MLESHSLIGAGEFKTHCLKLIDRVNQTKQPIIITKHGKPMAKLTPIEDETYTLFGCLNDHFLSRAIAFKRELN